VKVMFSTSAGYGHFLPVVPLAWAARASGHEVLVAATGAALLACGRAGLPAVEISPAPATEGGDYPPLVDQTQPPSSPGTLGARKLPTLGYAMPDRQMAALIIAAIESWRPDVIVTEFNDDMAPTAAGFHSIPIVLHGLGILPMGQTERRRQPRAVSAFERLGINTMPPKAAAMLDTCPPSMRESGRAAAWPMRFVPYNGGGVRPDWLDERPSSVRVCVTLGTVVPAIISMSEVEAVIDGMRDVDAEVIFVLGDVDCTPLGALPNNVHRTGWVPLSELLPTCAVIVHHGGAGTTMTAVAAGVPQLILPFREGDAVHRRGIGLTLTQEELEPLTIGRSVGRLLREPSFSIAADEVKRENAAQPSLFEVVRRLESLV